MGEFTYIEIPKRSSNHRVLAFLNFPYIFVLITLTGLFLKIILPFLNTLIKIFKNWNIVFLSIKFCFTSKGLLSPNFSILIDTYLEWENEQVCMELCDLWKGQYLPEIVLLGIYLELFSKRKWPAKIQIFIVASNKNVCEQQLNIFRCPSYSSKQIRKRNQKKPQKGKTKTPEYSIVYTPVFP